MKKSKSPINKLDQDSRSTKQLDKNERQISALEKDKEKWQSEVSVMTYEESINALDLLLENLQNDSIPLEKLQEYHLKGSMYLDHCQYLLDSAEHKVVELDPQSLAE